MNIKFKGFSLFVGVILLLTSYQSVEKNTDSWVVKNSKGLEVVSFSQVEELQMLSVAWKNKREVKVKMMPQFNYEITIKKNEISSLWLYAVNGYTMEKGNKNGMIYKVDLPVVNAKLTK